MGVYDKKIPGYIFDRGAQLFNVKHPDFAGGAKGDGVTNDTNAFKAALAAAAANEGGQVYFPTGRYVLTPTISGIGTIDVGEYVTVCGDGYTSELVPDLSVMTTGGDWRLIRFNSYVTFCDLRINFLGDEWVTTGFADAGPTAVLSWGDCHDYSFENVWVHNIKSVGGKECFGLSSRAGDYNFRFKNIRGWGVDGTPIHVTGNIELTGDPFAGTAMAYNAEVSGCVCWDNTWQGISTYGAYNVRISDSYFYDNGGHGINVEWARNIDVKDCVSTNNGYAGIGTWGQIQKMRVMDCTLYDNNPFLDRGEVQCRPGAWWTGAPPPDAAPEDIEFINCVILPRAGNVHFCTRAGTSVNQETSVPLKVRFVGPDTYNYTSRGELSSNRDGLCVLYDGWTPVRRAPMGALSTWTIAGGAFTNVAYSSGGNESSGARTLSTTTQYQNLLSPNLLEANKRYRLRVRMKPLDTASWVFKVTDIDNTDITGAYVNLPKHAIDVDQWFTFDVMVTMGAKNGHVKFIRDQATGSSSSIVVDWIRADECPSNVAHDPLVTEVDAKQFGCKGDGVTDDYLALSKAGIYLSSIGGGTIYFPDGVYVINTQWDLPANVHLRLADNATIKAGAAMTRMLTVGLSTLTTGTVIAGGKWDCDELAQTGMHTFLADDVIIKDTEILDPLYGYYIQVGTMSAADTAHRGAIRGVRGRRTSGTAVPSSSGGIHANRADGLVIEGCDIEGSQTGITISANSPNCRVLDNRVARGVDVTGNMTRGVYFASKGTLISNLHAESPSECGVYINAHQFALSNINVTNAYGPDNVAAGIEFASNFSGSINNLIVTGGASNQFLYDVAGFADACVIMGGRTEYCTNVLGDQFKVITALNGLTVTGGDFIISSPVWDVTGTDANHPDFNDEADSLGGATLITTKGALLMSVDNERQQFRFRASGTGEAGSGGTAYGYFNVNDFLIHRFEDDALLVDFFDYNVTPNTRNTALKIYADGFVEAGRIFSAPEGFHADGPAASGLREFSIKTAGSARWVLRPDTALETGANAGCNLDLVRRDDAGVALGTSLRIIRSSGALEMTDGTVKVAGVWNKPLYFGTTAYWTDATGAMRSMTGTPSSDLDGSLVGSAVAVNLDGLSDVIITTPATAQTLRYNGTNWVNAALASADLSDTANIPLKNAANIFTASQQIKATDARLWLGRDQTGGSEDMLLQATAWGQGGQVMWNVRYVSGDPVTASNYRYTVDPGGSNTRGGVFRFDGNSSTQFFKWFTFPISTNKDSTPASMTEVLRLGSAGLDIRANDLLLGGTSVITAAWVVQNVTGSIALWNSGNMAYAQLPSAGGTWNAGGGTVALTGGLTLSTTLGVTGTSTFGVVNTTGAVTVAVASGSVAFDARTTGDTGHRFRVLGSGALGLGDGAGTNLGTLTATAASGTVPATFHSSVALRATYLGISANAATYTAIQVSSTLAGAAAGRYGLFLNTSATYDAAMTTYRGIWVDNTLTEHASLTTISEMGGIRVGAPSKGASLVSITTQYGIRVDAQTLSGGAWGGAAAFAFYQAGTSDLNRFDGPIGMGQSPTGDYGIRLQKTNLGTSATQYGILNDITMASGATTNARAYYARVNIPDVAATFAVATGLHVANNTKGASATLTTSYGIYVEDQTAGASNFGIYAPGTTNFHWLAGRTGIGTNANSASASMLSVRGSNQTSSTTQYSINSATTFAADATTVMGVQVTWATTTGTTLTEGRMLSLTSPTLTGSTLATLYGARVVLTATTTTTYGVYVDSITGATTAYSFFGAGTANYNYFAGRTGIGTNSGATSSTMFSVRGSSQTTGTAQVSGGFVTTFDGSVATSSIQAVLARWVSTGTGTTTNAYAYYVQTASKGASHTVTNSYALYVEDQAGSGTNLWNFFFAGDQQSRHVGSLAIGTANAGTAYAFRVEKTLTDATTNSQNGTYVDVTVAGSGTQPWARNYFRIQLPNTARTYTDTASLVAAAPVKGAAATVTRGYSLYVETNTVGTAAYSLYVQGGHSQILGTLLVGTTATINASLAFQVESTTGFFRPPSMTAAQGAAVGSPADGAMWYQNDGTNKLQVRISGEWHRVTTYNPGTNNTEFEGVLTGSDMYISSNFEAAGGLFTGSVTFDNAFIITSGFGFAAIADASGGATIDTQARTAINALLARLRTRGDLNT